MLMSVLVNDAVAYLGPQDQNSFNRRDLATLLYADDTLLMGVSATAVNNFLEAVSHTGQNYGMELHWKKISIVATPV